MEVLEEFIDSPNLFEISDGVLQHLKAEGTITTNDVGELCPTCLSSGRSTRPLSDHEGAARALAMLLAGYFEEEQVEEFITFSRVCWECFRFLGRVATFQSQVLDANALLQSCWQGDGGELTVTPLSRLAKASSVGFDAELRHEPRPEPEAKPRVAKPAPGVVRRGRGRPRKHPAPETPVGKYNATKAKVSRRKRGAKFVRVRIGAAELAELRESERAGAAYARASFKCEMCVKGFSFVSLLEKHVRTKHSEEAGPHECPVCSIRFQDGATLERHRRRHYTLHSCGECGFTNPLLTNVERHYNALHEPGRTYPCGVCGEVFEQERKMRYHKETTHKPKYQCNHCNKVFNNVQVFKGHMLIHTGLPTLECSLCGKRCRGESGLYAHMRTAHRAGAAEEARCVECDVQFRNADGLRAHLRHSVRHATPARLRYECDKCKKKFLSETALRHHHQYYHLEYVCSICNKKLNSRYTFAKHMKFIHEGYEMPRKHVCDMCGKTFKTRIQMQTHQLTHTGERPHECEICGATFAQKSTLQTHRRLVHFKTPRALPAAAPQGAST